MSRIAWSLSVNFNNFICFVHRISDILVTIQLTQAIHSVMPQPVEAGWNLRLSHSLFTASLLHLAFFSFSPSGAEVLHWCKNVSPVFLYIYVCISTDVASERYSECFTQKPNHSTWMFNADLLHSLTVPSDLAQTQPEGSVHGKTPLLVPSLQDDGSPWCPVHHRPLHQLCADD